MSFSIAYVKQFSDGGVIIIHVIWAIILSFMKNQNLFWRPTNTVVVRVRLKQGHLVSSASAVLCVLTKRCLLRMDTRATFISSLASLSPIQLRGPSPIGR